MPLGTPLATFSLTALTEGAYRLFITDGDEKGADDLAGPIPPLPPVALPYSSVDATLVVIPEPGTAALLIGPLAWLSIRRRKLAPSR